jgi:murein L,D-transpeptidase YcbB/YkuD
VAGLVAALEPRLVQYRNLRALLARYRTLAADSTLRPLPAGPPVHPGEQYAALAELRHTLVALGDLAPDSAGAPGDVYQGATAEAVRRFQRRHALEPDGIVVNIPAFRLLAFEPEAVGGPSLTMRVVVGRALDKRTPVLLEELRYVEFRPYWNVPRSILVDEIIPRLRRDPGYLRANQMEVVGAKDGVVGDEVTLVVLARLERGELRVRQRPGPANALGLAKFVFPNAADVYMHGTPQTQLFARARRDFSHGCIRLEDPTALALWVLEDRLEWSRERMDSAMAGPGTTRVLLARPMPVLVFYTTAVARADGTASFYSDVYGLDRRLAEALRAGPGPP